MTVMPMKKFQWMRHDEYTPRLLGIQYRTYHSRVLHIGFWFGSFRWEIDW